VVREGDEKARGEAEKEAPASEPRPDSAVPPVAAFAARRVGGWPRAGTASWGLCGAQPNPGPYSITSSARARRVGGIVRPSARALRMFMQSSNVDGCSTGKSAGREPFRTLSTNAAAR
jgi:hypothetical protein